MKYYLTFILLFCINSSATVFKEKILICIDEKKYINKDIAKSDYIFGYIFNNISADYYYNTVKDNNMYETNKILNIKYNLNSEFIILELEYGNLFIDRKTYEHSFNNYITARCEVGKNKKFFFDLLNDRKKKLNNQIYEKQ